MTDTPEPVAPADDHAFADAAAQMAIDIWARDGDFRPFGLVETPAGNAVIPVPDDFGVSEATKFMHMNVLRLASIDHDGRRSAFAFESWALLSKDPADWKIAKEISARGGSLQDHPAVAEVIMVLVESDQGCIMRVNRIARDGVTVTLKAADERFSPGIAPAGARGIYSGFHVPTALRSDPVIQRFAADMRAMVDPSTIRLDHRGAPAIH